MSAEQRILKLLGIASGQAAGNVATADGPKYLRKYLNYDFQEILEPECDSRQKCGLDDLMLTIKQLNDRVFNLLDTNCKPLVIGGDHSIALGTWSAVADYVADSYQQDLVLLWLDAHLDCHTSETSPSGNHHGMAAASLLGEYTDGFNLGKAFIKPENIHFIGSRSYESEEMDLIKRLKIKVHDMKEVNQKGLDKLVMQIIKDASKHGKKVGLTLDIDIFEPALMPGTGTKAPDGADPKQFLALMPELISSPDVLALEIVEYNPSLDKDQLTYKFFTELKSIIG